MMDKTYNTCCFSGHRIFYNKNVNEIKREVTRVIEDLIKSGVTTFKAGGALGFDTLCSQVVILLKEKYPQIQLQLILPCKRQTRNWNPHDKKVYKEIFDRADEAFYLFEHYFDGCMQMRNRALVDGSDCCVAYLCRHYGGTYYTVNYAKEKGLEVILVGM